MRLEELYEIIKKRKISKSRSSYIVSLVNMGLDCIIQKVGEEAVEVVIAAKNSDKTRIVSETADLLFHLLILLESYGITINDIYEELRSRNK